MPHGLREFVKAGILRMKTQRAIDEHGACVRLGSSLKGLGSKSR